MHAHAGDDAGPDAGIAPRAVLSPDELSGHQETTLHQPATLSTAGGGLVIVGSHVPTSSAQLRELLAGGRTANVELNVRAALAQESRPGECARAAESVNAALAAGRDTVLYTSRELVTGGDALESLSICRRVSEALVTVLERVTSRPRFIVAKGGITSSDLVTRALQVRRALVVGQILPGVPLWRLGDESRWPGMIYVSFPGNLGGRTALQDALDKLSSKRPAGAA